MPAGASRRDMKGVVDWARAEGCDVEAHKGLWRVTYGGRLVGAIAQTPSDPRAHLNAKAFLRRNLAKIKEANPT
jgi:hypothetical protein